MILVSGATATVERYALSGRIGRLLRPGNGNMPDRLPWAVDNGSFKNFDEPAFLNLLSRLKDIPGCLWVAAPDVVGDHRETLARFHGWQPRIRAMGFPIAFVLQDGCSIETVPWEELDAVFIGGTTRFKLSDLAHRLTDRARSLGKRTHMGRVNSARRIRTASDFGCETIDGTAFSMFSDLYIPWGIAQLERVERQRTIWEIK